jgi:hypothetical protein
MAGRGRPPLHREPVGASSASAEGDPPDAHHVRWSSIPATLRASGWTPLYGNARGQGQSERAATVAGLRGGCPSTRRLSASASCQIDRRSQWRIAAPAPKRPNSPRPVEDNGPIFVDEARDPDVLRMDLDAVAAFDRPALLTGGTESAPFFGPVVDMVAGPCRGPSASRSRAPTTRRTSASRTLRRAGHDVYVRRGDRSGGPAWVPKRPRGCAGSRVTRVTLSDLPTSGPAPWTVASSRLHWLRRSPRSAARGCWRPQCWCPPRRRCCHF